VQRQGPIQISYGKEYGTNGVYGSRSHGGHRSGRDEMIIDGKFLDTPDMIGDGNRYYSSSGSDRNYDHHHYHLYRSSDRGNFSKDFKKWKPPNFYGELKNPEDAKAWLVGMNKFFELNEYTKNMNGIITIFNLKGKAYI